MAPQSRKGISFHTKGGSPVPSSWGIEGARVGRTPTPWFRVSALDHSSRMGGRLVMDLLSGADVVEEFVRVVEGEVGRVKEERLLRVDQWMLMFVSF